LTQNMDGMSNIRSSNSEINKAAHNVSISRGILKRSTMSGTKLKMKIYRCCSCPMVSDTKTSNKVLYVLGLRKVAALCRLFNLNA